MKPLSVLLLCALCSCGTTRLTAVGGMSDFGSDLEPVEEHSTAGLEMSQVPEEGGFGFELGARYGEDSAAELGVSQKLESLEGYAGPRYEWRWGKFTPYLSAGLSFLRLESRVGDSPSEHDSDIGFYGNAGVDLALGEHWFFGAAARMTADHDMVFSDVSGDADAWQYLFRFGYSF
jgi:opacity protein-like surface antigen